MPPHDLPRLAHRAQNATVCPTDQLDWYTSVIGESPCRTYERLRQICDSRYAVGVFNSTMPGDVCDSRVTSCCCNSIAFNLAMLCMNCQHAGSATEAPNGIDANPGTYGQYLNNCSPPMNRSLPIEIQAGVCTEQIDLRPRLYDAGWIGDGAWFYSNYRGSFDIDLAGETGKNLTNCPNKAFVSSPSSSSSSTIPISTISTTSSTTATSSSSIFSALTPSNKSLDVGSIVGSVVGSVAVLLLALAAALWWRRRRTEHKTGIAEANDLHAINPFLDGEAAPPPYNAQLCKSALPPPPSARQPPPSSAAHRPSHAGSGSSLGSGSSSNMALDAGSAHGISKASHESNTTTALGVSSESSSQAGGATTENARRIREKASGWRFSGKPPPPEVP